MILQVAGIQFNLSFRRGKFLPIVSPAIYHVYGGPRCRYNCVACELASADIRAILSLMVEKLEYNKCVVARKCVVGGVF